MQVDRGNRSLGEEPATEVYEEMLRLVAKYVTGKLFQKT